LANPPLDLSDAQLNNIDFTDSSPMYHVSLVGVHLKNASFRRQVDLTDAVFERTKTDVPTSNDFCIFEQAKMIRTNFNYAKFETRNVQFIECNLATSTFHRAHMDGSSFIFCNMAYTNLTNASFAGTNFTGSLLMFANLTFTILYDSIFDYTDLQSANLFGAVCEGKCTLSTVLSLDNTILSNGTLHPENMGNSLYIGEINLAW